MAAVALFVLLVSGLGIAAPLANAQSSVVVTIPIGSGQNPSAAPGFSPDNITIVMGVNNTVTWVNEDVVYHSVYSSTIPTGASAFHSLRIGYQDNFTLTFTVPGTYYYYCNLHSWMTGTVTVKAAPVPAPEFPAAYLAMILFAAISAAAIAAPRPRQRATSPA